MTFPGYAMARVHFFLFFFHRKIQSDSFRPWRLFFSIFSRRFCIEGNENTCSEIDQMFQMNNSRFFIVQQFLYHSFGYKLVLIRNLKGANIYIVSYVL